MRWILAAVLFALAVSLAIGTAAIRVENTRMRFEVQQIYDEVRDRIVERRRLYIERLEDATPEHLAEALWAHLRAEQARRQEWLQ
jgi:hypothetical protein